jgi:hypothetical protein
MVSDQLAYYGGPGHGRWITVSANAEHVTGPRWKMAAPESRNLPTFAVRYPSDR